jgi:hypothetical protein
MRDIVEVITEKEIQIAALEEDIVALRRAAAILGSQNGHKSFQPILAKEHKARPKQKSGPGKYEIPVGDAAERVLLDAGKALHLDEILSRMAILGTDPPRTSLESAMRKDSRERFVLKGKRVYDLKQRGVPLAK